MDGVGEAPELAFGFDAPPLARVSLPGFSLLLSPAPRRLSSCFGEPSRALPASRRRPACISLQGRLVGAEEATSAGTVGCGLSLGDAVAWELFTPMQRVLLVAVVAAAAAESKKARRVAQLQKSVDIRDQVLSDMQQKLDDLCEQISLNEQSRDHDSKPSAMKYESSWKDQLEAGLDESQNCDLPDLNLKTENSALLLNTISPNEKKVNSVTDYRKDDTFYMSNMPGQEERRMSDLSDICSSATSSVDIQFSTLAAGQDYYNLRKECEEKDEIIKDLTASSRASNAANSKRITDLEDMVRRKKMIITKLRRDMIILEQKVSQLTRQQRSSSVTPNSNDSKLPVMSSNLLYDMSSSSPSSDSDCSTEKYGRHIDSSTFPCSQTMYESCEKDRSATTESQKTLPSKDPASLVRSKGWQQQQSRSPLKESSSNHNIDLGSTPRPRQLSASVGDAKQTRRRLRGEQKHTLQPRWM